jgi:demethylmacrocin O-methyltransferase
MTQIPQKKILDFHPNISFKRLKLRVRSLVYKRNLPKLALLFHTDKEGLHSYAKHYQHHFKSQRRKKLNILEIGVGGYENPKDGGQSLRMWKAYFPNSNIFGIDIYDKTLHDERRIKTFKGSQVDEGFLRDVVSAMGTVDIIIDDGSHYSNHVITAFKILFPMLNHNGIYVVEDLQTSYWDNVIGECWGGSSDLKASHTSMNFFKPLVDGLNYEEFTLDGYSPTYFDQHIISMHFYHNILFIYKGLNNEGSNVFGKRFKQDSEWATGSVQR